MLPALLQVCTHYLILMLLSSTGCGRFLIKSAAQAKKKQKTAMQDIVPCLQKIMQMQALFIANYMTFDHALTL